MTTDITELAQSLKAAAEKWQEAWGKYDKVEITIAEFIRAANQYESIVKDPANVLALVKALEKAEQQIIALQQRHEVDPRTHEIIDLKERITELESEIEKWKQESEAWEQVAEKHLSTAIELESRTVKLPKLKMLEDYLAEVAIEERKQILVGVKLEFHRALAAAGINGEAE